MTGKKKEKTDNKVVSRLEEIKKELVELKDKLDKQLIDKKRE